MSVFVVNHKVNNFETWKKVYDGFDATRAKYGITDHFVLQSVADPKHITVVGEASLEQVQKFLGSEDLKQGMQSAGVAGPPVIFIGESQL